MNYKSFLLLLACAFMLQAHSCKNEFVGKPAQLKPEEIWWNELDDTWKELCLREVDQLGEKINTKILEEILELKRFNLDYYPINENNLKPLEKLKHISQLSAGNTQITNLSSLKSLKHITYLNIPSTPIEDLSPLKDLENLEELYIQQTLIHDLSPLSNAINLQVLILHETSVISIKPIIGLPKLSILGIGNLSIPEKEIEEFRFRHPNCEIH